MQQGMGPLMKVLAGLCLLACFAGCAFGQDEGELTAKKRLLPGVGPGLRAVKRGADGNYYVLSAPGSSASVFDAAGRVGQAFGMGGAPFGVSFFKGCGLSPYADSLLFALACTELLMAWRNSMLVLVWYPRP
jgi:hypothetical protein